MPNILRKISKKCTVQKKYKYKYKYRVCMLGGHEEIGYYKHCQWILAGGHLTMKIYLAYPGQPLVSSQLFAAPLTQLSLAPHQALWLRVQLRTTLSVFT